MNPLSLKILDSSIYYPIKREVNKELDDHLGSTEVVIESSHPIFKRLREDGKEIKISVKKLSAYFNGMLEKCQCQSTTLLGGSKVTLKEFGSIIQPDSNDFDLFIPLGPQELDIMKTGIIQCFLQTQVIPHISNIYPQTTTIDIIDSFSPYDNQYNAHCIKLGPQLDVIFLLNQQLEITYQSPYNGFLHDLKSGITFARTCFGSEEQLCQAILTGEIQIFPQDKIPLFNVYLFLHWMLLKTTGVKVPDVILDAIFTCLLDKKLPKTAFDDLITHDFTKRLPIQKINPRDPEEARLSYLMNTVSDLQRSLKGKLRPAKELLEFIYGEMKKIITGSKEKTFAYLLGKRIEANQHNLSSVYTTIYFLTMIRPQKEDTKFRRCTDPNLKEGFTLRKRKGDSSVILIELSRQNNPWSINIVLNKDLADLSKLSEDTAFQAFAKMGWSKSQEATFEKIKNASDNDKISLSYAILTEGELDALFKTYQLPSDVMLSEYRESLISILTDLNKISNTKMYLGAAGKILSILEYMGTDKQVLIDFHKHYDTVFASLLIRESSLFETYRLRSISPARMAYQVLIQLCLLVEDKHDFTECLNVLLPILTTSLDQFGDEEKIKLYRGVKTLFSSCPKTNLAFVVLVAEFFQRTYTPNAIVLKDNQANNGNIEALKISERQQRDAKQFSQLITKKGDLLDVKQLETLFDLLTQHYPLADPNNRFDILTTVLSLSSKRHHVGLSAKIMLELLKMNWPSDKDKKEWAVKCVKALIGEATPENQALKFVIDLLPYTHAEELMIYLINQKKLLLKEPKETLLPFPSDSSSPLHPLNALSSYFEAMQKLGQQITDIQNKQSYDLLHDVFQVIKFWNKKNLINAVITTKKNIVNQDVYGVMGEIANRLIHLGLEGKIPKNLTEELESLFNEYATYIQVQDSADFAFLIDKLLAKKSLFGKLSYKNRSTIFDIVLKGLCKYHSSLQDLLGSVFDLLYQCICLDNESLTSLETNTVGPNFLQLLLTYKNIYVARQEFSKIVEMHNKLINMQADVKDRIFCYNICCQHSQEMVKSAYDQKNRDQALVATKILFGHIEAGIQWSQGYDGIAPYILGWLEFAIQKSVIASLDEYPVQLILKFLESGINNSVLRVPPFAIRFKAMVTSVCDKILSKKQLREKVLNDFLIRKKIFWTVCTGLSNVGYLSDIDLAFKECKALLDLLGEHHACKLMGEFPSGYVNAATQYVDTILDVMDSMVGTFLNQTQRGRFWKRVSSYHYATEIKRMMYPTVDLPPVSEPKTMSEQDYQKSWQWLLSCANEYCEKVKTLNNTFKGIFDVQIFSLLALVAKMKIFNLYNSESKNHASQMLTAIDNLKMTNPLSHTFSSDISLANVYYLAVTKPNEPQLIFDEFLKVKCDNAKPYQQENAIMVLKWLIIYLYLHVNKDLRSVAKKILLDSKMLKEHFQPSDRQMTYLVGEILMSLIEMPSCTNPEAFDDALDILKMYLFESHKPFDNMTMFLTETLRTILLTNNAKIVMDQKSYDWTLVKRYLAFLCHCKITLCIDDETDKTKLANEVKLINNDIDPLINSFVTEGAKPTLSQQFYQTFKQTLTAFFTKMSKDKKNELLINGLLVEASNLGLINKDE